MGGKLPDRNHHIISMINGRLPHPDSLFQRKTALEFTKVRKNTYITKVDWTNIGMYRIGGGDEVVLIDTGYHYSPEFMELLEREGVQVLAVIHTHLHIDHIGNSDAVLKRYGAAMYAQEKEEDNEEKKEYGVDFPVIYTRENETVSVKGAKFHTIFTPGHSPGHQLVVTPDEVCFLGDAILSKSFLAHSKTPYMFDAAQSVKSMEKIKDLVYPVFVAAHDGVIPKEDYRDTVQKNINRHLRLFEMILQSARKPVDWETLVDRSLIASGVHNPEARQYGWMVDASTARIKNLLDSGVLVRENGLIVWRKALIH